MRKGELTEFFRVDFDQRAELLAADPKTYYLKDHYVNYPVVLVRLTHVHADTLRDLLLMGWRFVSTRGRSSGARKAEALDRSH